MMKILHADHHGLFREGICHILKHWDAKLEFLQADSLQNTLDILSMHNDIDLILLDLYMTSMNGFTGFKTIWKCNPTIPVVILSEPDDPKEIKTAIDLGTAGYIPKSSTGQTLISALKLVLDGGIYAPRVGIQSSVRDSEGGSGSLTQRQLEVLALIAEGLPNKAIARKLFVSEATIKGHVTAILNALGVDNRVQAINKTRPGRARFRTVVG